MTDLNDMLVFARVAKEAGFTAAAKTLGIPRSNVSRRVARLEQSLDARLLERTTRKLHLTEAGELYYRHCRRIEEEVEHAEASLQELLEAPRGHLRVSASVTTGQHLIGPHLAQFLASFPDVQVELELTNRRIDLIEEGIDVALRVGRLEPSTLIARFVATLQSFIYASPAYLEEHGQPRRIDSLSRHRCLNMTDSQTPQVWTLARNSGELRTVKMDFVASTNDLATLREVVLSGAGLAVLPDYMCAADEVAGRLVRVLPMWRPASVDCHLVYPSRGGATPKVKAFADFLADRISTQLLRREARPPPVASYRGISGE